jgi:hypothetical protein
MKYAILTGMLAFSMLAHAAVYDGVPAYGSFDDSLKMFGTGISIFVYGVTGNHDKMAQTYASVREYKIKQAMNADYDGGGAPPTLTAEIAAADEKTQAALTTASAPVKEALISSAATFKEQLIKEKKPLIRNCLTLSNTQKPAITANTCRIAVPVPTATTSYPTPNTGITPTPKVTVTTANVAEIESKIDKYSMYLR